MIYNTSDLLSKRRVELAIVVATLIYAECTAFTPPLMPAATPPRVPHSASLGPNSLQLQAPPLLSDGKRQRHRKDVSCYALYSTPSSDSDQDMDKIQYIRPYLKQLFLLCRPTNFPVVALFHVLGVYQAVQLWESTSSSTTASLLLPVLKHPSMLVVLLALLLVTSTSMITNDYYDARNGVASITNDETSHSENNHYHPLAWGEVPFSITKTFDSYLYAILLLSSAFVPGAISRVLVIGGAIITYLYTVHLKPKTWIKNLSCAALVAMSPVTSGLAAWNILCCGGVETGTFSNLPYHLIFKSPLSFLVVALFAGILGREILMDITDCEGDAKAGIETVPVKYGKKSAAFAALACSLLASISTCAASLIPLIRRMVQGGQTIKSLITVPSLASLPTILSNHDVRKVLLAVSGSVILIQRTYSVWATNGDDANLAERAIRDSMFSVLLVLASFT